MASSEPVTLTLVRSERAAAISAVSSAVFGAALIAWSANVHSVSMTAGGVLALVRGVMGALLIAGLRLSRRHSSEFPDGLYKLENVIACVIGVMVLAGSYILARISIGHLDKAYIFSSDPKYALPFFLAAALLAGGMGFYKRRVAKAEGCPSLKADSYFSFADAGAMVIIGVALALDIAGLHRVDAIAGLIVACLLAFVGVYIFLGGLKVLLDASVDRKTLSRVAEVAAADPGVRKVVAVDGRNSGSFIFLHVTVEPVAYDLRQADEVARQLERAIKTAIPNVDRASIEFSVPPGAFTAAVPVDSDGRSLFTDFASAPRIAFIEFDNGDASGSPDLVDNPAAGVSAGRAVHLAVFLGKRPVDVLLLREDLADRDAVETLKAYGIDVSANATIGDIDGALLELAKHPRAQTTQSPDAGEAAGGER